MHPLPSLTPECSACTALCCMALPFDAGEDFAEDKPALHPCRHLEGYRCGLHARLTKAGYRGCALFDCQGAGQRLVQMWPGADWRRDPALRAPLAQAFGRLRRVHGALALLASAGRLALDAGQRARHAALLDALNPKAGLDRAALADLDLVELERQLAQFLQSLRPLAGALRRSPGSSTSAGKTTGDAPWP